MVKHGKTTWLHSFSSVSLATKPHFSQLWWNSGIPQAPSFVVALAAADYHLSSAHELACPNLHEGIWQNGDVVFTVVIVLYIGIIYIYI